MRNNTEHHSLALYPVRLEKNSRVAMILCYFLSPCAYKLWPAKGCSLFFRDEHGCKIRENIPQVLYSGIDYTVFVEDPDGHLIQLYAYMEQIGWDGRPRPTYQRKQVTPGDWPETIEPTSDVFMGEPFLGPLG